MKLRGLYQKGRDGIFYFQPPQSGGIRPPAVSLRTRDRDAAVARYLELSQAAEVATAGGALSHEIARYLSAMERSAKLTTQSRKSAEYTLNRLADHLGKHRNLSRIATADLSRFQASLEGTVSPSTVRTYVALISSFFRWAQTENLISENPAKGLEIPRTIRTRRERYCTREEREKLIGECPREDVALILWLGFFAGLRLNEIIEARPDWVDMEAGTLTVENTDTFTTKDKRHRTIRLSPRLKAFLQGYGLRSPFLLRPDKGHGPKPTGRKSSKWLRYRYEPRRPFKAHVKAAGLPWVTFHTLRRTFATLHAIAGTPLTTIARELGDDERTTYQNYIGYSRHSGHAEAID